MDANDFDALPQLHKAGHDDHSCGALTQDLMNGAGQLRGETREIVLDGGDGRKAVVSFNSKGKIKGIIIPSSLKQRFDDIVATASRKTAKKVISTTLLGYRPLEKYYRVGDWIQLRPLDAAVIDMTVTQWPVGMPILDGRPHPFVLEVAYTSIPELPAFDAHRRMVAINEARLLVSSFLELPVHQNVSTYAWALSAESKSILMRCFVPGLENPSESGFSDVSGLQSLHATDEATYFKRGGVGAATFEVPDMEKLRAQYDALNPDDRTRFLRACANLWESADPASGDGKRLVSSVSAIEALLPKGKKCSTCGSHTGIAQSYRCFVRRFVPTSREELLTLYEALYPVRSNIAHGAWHEMVDQPMFGLTMRDASQVRLASWHAAKVGAIGWLNGGGNSKAWWENCDNGSEA